METKRWTIQGVKNHLNGKNQIDEQLIELWRCDPRAGVQNAVLQWEKRLEKEKLEIFEYEKRMQFERDLWQKGYRLIAGIDEVGRGPLAGPVAAAAVILPGDFKLYGVNDSKKISAVKRERLYEQIYEEAIDVGIGFVDNRMIDEINIYEASKLAMQRAIEDLVMSPDYLLIDAMELTIKLPQEKIIKGDAKSISIGAASIIAKVTRDRLMTEMDELYPMYDFKNNAGYGTKAHLEGIKDYGICELHRRSFEPIKSLINN